MKTIVELAVEHGVKIKAVYEPSDNEWIVKITEVVDPDDKVISGIGDDLPTAMQDWLRQANEHPELRLRQKVDQFEKISLK